MILLNLALIPVFLIIIYFYKRDKFEREPLYLTFQTFILGFMLVFPAIFFEKLLTGLFQDTYFNFITFFLYIFNLPKKDFNEPYDGIFYAVIVSLGFAAIENILYVFQRGAIVGILRAFTAVPAHTIFAVFMGFFTGVYKFTGKKIFVFLSLIIPMLLHTIYDMIAMSRMSYGFFTLFLFIIFFVIFSLFLMQKQISKSPFRILR